MTDTQTKTQTKLMHHLIYPINALPSVQMVDAGIHDLLWSIDIKFEALKRYYEKVDAAILFYFSDIVIQAEAMGAEVRYSNDAMPSIFSPARSISVPNPNNVPRMKINARVLTRMDQEFPNKLRAAPVFGPFTVAGQVVGEETLLRMLVDDPKAVMNLLEKALEGARRYTDYIVEAGANLVSVADPLSVLIPPDKFWEYAGDLLRRLIEPYHLLPTILHICGDTLQIVEEMVKTGVGGISFDNCMDLMSLEDQIPHDVYIIGNIDPVEVIELGSPEEVVSQTSDLVHMMALKDNFVLSTGCAVPPFAPVENVSLFLETGRKTFTDLRHDIPQLSQISESVFTGNIEKTKKEVSVALEKGINPLVIVTSGLTRAIRKGSALYEVKRCFLPSILLMVDSFYKGFQLLESRLHRHDTQGVDIVLGTVKGDIHEIGKNLLKIFFEIHGYQVVDLGIDVDAEEFIEAYQHYSPAFIGLSAFTTKSKEEIGRIINSFRQKGGIDSFVIIGGAAVSDSIAHSLGADGYARDAIRAVSLVKKLLHESKGQRIQAKRLNKFG